MLLKKAYLRHSTLAISLIYAAFTIFILQDELGRRNRRLKGRHVGNAEESEEKTTQSGDSALIRSLDSGWARDSSRRALDNNKKQSTQGEFSGCLLLRDENHQLSEWLAYHYVALRLRNLVVSVDPTSMASPLEILSRWTKDTDEEFPGMNYVLWNISDFYDGRRTGENGHLQRQRFFVQSCVQYHKKMNRTWVLLTDPDEFISLNKVEEGDPTNSFKEKAYGDDMGDYFPRLYQKALDLGLNYPSHSLKVKRPDLWAKRERKVNARKLQSDITFRDGASFIDVLNKSPWTEDTCLVLPRFTFSSVESPANVVLQSKAIEYGFNPIKFRTLRNFHYTGKAYGLWGKAVLDVSRISEDDLGVMPENIHSPFPSCGWPEAKPEEEVLMVHHYLGSWEEYSYKLDCRRNRDLFDTQSKESTLSTNYNLQNWLEDFVNEVGISRAKHLLEGAGEIPVANANSSGCLHAV